MPWKAISPTSSLICSRAGRISAETSFQRHQLCPTCRMSYFLGGTLAGSITSSGLNPKMGSVVTFGSPEGVMVGLMIRSVSAS